MTSYFLADIPGLAESLRSELLLYGISVQAYFPGTILSPGLEEENKTKPKITLEIEGAEEGLTPAQCAKGLIKGELAKHINTRCIYFSGSFRLLFQYGARKPCLSKIR